MELPEPFSSLLVIIIVACIGAVLSKRGWFPSGSVTIITKIILDLAIPLSFVYNMVTNVDMEMLKNLSLSLLIPVISIGLGYLISYGLTKLLKTPDNRQGLFISMFANPNSLFIGLPVNIAVFGTQSMPYAYIFYFVSTLYFNTFGLYFLSKGRGEQNTLKNVADTVKSPIFISFVLAVILVLAQIKLPGFVLAVCDKVGSLATPLSMLFIGICVSGLPIKHIRITRDLVIIILARFVVSPLVALGVAQFFDISELGRNVFILQSLLPVMTSTPIFSERYGCDTKYATLSTAVTAMLAIGIIPLYSSLFF